MACGGSGGHWKWLGANWGWPREDMGVMEGLKGGMEKKAGSLDAPELRESWLGGEEGQAGWRPLAHGMGRSQRTCPGEEEDASPSLPTLLTRVVSSRSGGESRRFSPRQGSLSRSEGLTQRHVSQWPEHRVGDVGRPGRT